MKADLLLLGHGSRDEEGAREFLELLERVRQALPATRVEGGVLEFAGPVAPPIQTAVDRLAAAGARKIVAQPVLLFDAGHNQDDMPAHHARLKQRYPQVTSRLGQPFGLHPALRAIVKDRAQAVASDDPAWQPTALLLVARGTHHPTANADMMKLVRLVWEEQRNLFPLVEGAFVSLAEPYVPEGIRRCVALGARQVVVVPYFLNTGVLVKRIAEQAVQTAQALPGIRVQVAGHLGLDPRLIQALVEVVEREDAQWFAAEGCSDAS